MKSYLVETQRDEMNKTQTNVQAVNLTVDDYGQGNQEPDLVVTELI